MISIHKGIEALYWAEKSAGDLRRDGSKTLRR
jgi:hypothetical protein